MSESNVSLLQVPLDQIRPNPIVALRPLHLETEAFAQMVESIREQGILNSVSLRPLKDVETGEDYYEIIDGLHRCSAAKEAGLTTIPASIHSDMDDAAVLEAQFVANAHTIETKNAEYAKHLERILTHNPMRTEAELAQKLGRSPQWLRDRLRINKIKDEKILKLINDGQICVNNATALAKLPPEEMEEWVSRAIELPAQEFIVEANTRVKEVKDAIRKGKQAAPAEFNPVAHAQKVSTLKSEMESGTIGVALVTELRITDPIKAFQLAIQWVLHMDPKSLEEAKAKHEQKRAEVEERKQKKAQKKAEDNAKKKAEEAAKAQAAAQAIAESN